MQASVPELHILRLGLDCCQGSSSRSLHGKTIAHYALFWPTGDTTNSGHLGTHDYRVAKLDFVCVS